jgi:protein-S-isoprenylcysteine O-methyltransferase Ste14
MVRLLAALIAATNASAWLLISRWERPGRSAELRAGLRAPRLIDRPGDVAQVAPLVYPFLVVIAPGWAYEGWTNWSSGIDGVLQAVGLGLWLLGMAVLLWASRVLGKYMAVNGVTVDHELVTRGPYRYVRHPVYGSFAVISVGTTLVFRSYVLLGLSLVWIAASLWWAAAEEKLFTSRDGFGDAYRGYASRTGRFLPRVRRAPGQRSAP